LEHFLAKEWRHVNTVKRGGGRRFISLDEDSAENRFGLEPAHAETPEKLFERPTYVARAKPRGRLSTPASLAHHCRPGLRQRSAALAPAVSRDVAASSAPPESLGFLVSGMG
jgi:hypothetical protein